MQILRPLLPALAVVTFTGCSDSTVSPAAPEAPSFGLAAPRHAAVGAGHVQSPAGLREFTFHALELASGGATGSYKVVLPSGLFFEADVTCLAVEGGTGWVGGVIRSSNAAVVVIGSTSMFYAIDNGEGGEGVDVVSLAAFNLGAGQDLAFCEERPLLLPPLTVTDGNVQVR